MMTLNLSSETVKKSMKQNNPILIAKSGLAAAVAVVVLFGLALSVPSASAQTLLMQFNFESTNTVTSFQTTDSVAGVIMNITNAAGAPTDMHGALGTGVGGVGRCIDFSSAGANNNANPVVCTVNNSSVNFGAITNFIATLWVKPTGGAPEFARYFGFGAGSDVDNGAAGSFAFEANNNFTSVQPTVNTVNTTVSGLNIIPNQWNFIAYTYDGTTIRFFEGTDVSPVYQAGSIANSGGAVNIGSAFSLWLGNRPNGRTRGFPASYSDMRVYTYTNTATTNLLEAIRESSFPDPYVIPTTIVPNTAIVGDSVTVSAQAYGTQPITYQWQHAGTNIASATSSTYTIPLVALTDAGSYDLVISNNSGGITPTVVTNTAAILAVRSSVDTLAWLGTNSANWDLASPNWSNTVTTAGGVAYIAADNVQFTDASTNLSITLTTNTLYPSSVTVSSSTNYTFGGTGSLAGQMTLTQNGPGMLTINNANAFSGSVTVNGGIMRMGNAGALGTNEVTVASGATLDFNGVQGPGPLIVNVQGSGSTNQGALYNSSGTVLQNGAGMHGFTMLGDTTIGANGRWDLYGSAGSTGLNGNGHNLTKIGSGSVWLIDSGTNNQLENITILGGTLGFQGTNNLGDPAATAAAYGAGLGFFAIPSDQTINKNIILSNATFTTSGGSLTMNSSIALTGTNVIAAGYQESNTFDVVFNGPMSGTGGWNIGSIQNYFFEGTNTYSGPTILNANSVLTVGANSSLGTSSLINLVNPNATLDVGAMPAGLILGGGQTLEGVANSIILTNIGGINGNIILNTGSTLSPNEALPGELTFNNNLAMTNATINIDLGSDPTQEGNGINSFIFVNGTLALGGLNTIQISPVGPLSSAQPYTIVNYGALTGGASNLHISSSNPRYTISLVDPNTTAGALELSVSGVPQPLIWKGGETPQPNIWDHTYTNFFNSYTNAFDHFYDGDLVTFDDTSITNNVNLTQIVTPGLLTFNNSVTNFNFYGAGAIGGTMDKEGTAAVTLSMSNTPAFLYVTNNAGTLAFNLAVSNASVPATILDNGSGLGTIVQESTNQLTLTGNNTGYNGAIVVSNGVLAYSSTASLGGLGTIYATNTGTLNLGTVASVTTGTKTIVIAGAGYNGQGAINGGAGGGPVPMMTGTLTLSNNATIAASSRWDFATGSTLNANGFTLNKQGTADIWLITANNSTMGNVNITQGVLGFQQGTSMGVTNDVITVESNATCGLWANATTPLNKLITLNGSATIASGGDTNVLLGAITLVTNNTLSVSTAMYLYGPLVGTGGYTVAGGSVLYLLGTNTYSGRTTIGGNSTVSVQPNSSLGSSPTIEIDGGSTLDVSAPGSYTFGAGQTLTGNGTLRGSYIYFGSGSTLSLGFSGSTYNLAVTTNLFFLAGSTNDVVINPGATTNIPSDTVVGPTSVTLGGTLVLNNIGNALAVGDAIKLFTATNYAGSFANIIPAIPGPGLAWNTNSLISNGTLYVTTGTPISVPAITSIKLSGSTLTITGTNGTDSGSYILLGTTNVAQPLANWTPILTNSFDSSGNLNLSTNIINPAVPGEFYIIKQ